MDGRTNGRTDVGTTMDGCMHGCMVRFINRRMSGWTNKDLLTFAYAVSVAKSYALDFLKISSKNPDK